MRAWVAVVVGALAAAVEVVTVAGAIRLPSGDGCALPASAPGGCEAPLPPASAAVASMRRAVLSRACRAMSAIRLVDRAGSRVPSAFESFGSVVESTFRLPFESVFESG
jgi:hypothetical protein